MSGLLILHKIEREDLLLFLKFTFMPGSSEEISIGNNCFISRKASLRGNVNIGDRVIILDFASIRGDLESITIEEDSNVQDNCTFHADPGFPVHIGKRVSVGHNAIVHGASIDDDCIVGMGAIVMNGSHVGSGTVIGAGAIILENQKIPENSLVVGVPGRVVRTDTGYREMARQNAEEYGRLREMYMVGKFLPYE